MGLYNLIEGFRVLGLPIPDTPAQDVSLQAIEGKITNPNIHRRLGASRSIPLVRRAELIANLLDSFSETGDHSFLFAAQKEYDTVLGSVPVSTRDRLATVAASAFNYFSFELSLAQRLKAGDVFARHELAEYVLRRGSDAMIYAILLQDLDGITDPALTTALRYRQGLWDVADDLKDFEQDRLTTGVNILLLTHNNLTALRVFVDEFMREGYSFFGQFPVVQQAAEEQYNFIQSVL